MVSHKFHARSERMAGLLRVFYDLSVEPKRALTSGSESSGSSFGSFTAPSSPSAASPFAEALETATGPASGMAGESESTGMSATADAMMLSEGEGTAENESSTAVG